MTDVPETVMELVVVVRVTTTPRASAHGRVAIRGIVSPRALARDGIVLVPRRRADGVAS